MKLVAQDMNFNGTYAMRVRAVGDKGEPLPFEDRVRDLRTLAERTRLIKGLVEELGATEEASRAAVQQLLLESRRAADAGAEGVMEAPQGAPQDRLLAYVAKMGGLLFVDQHGVPHVAINGDGTLVHAIDSRRTRRWLASLMLGKEEKAPSGEALHSAVLALEARAEQTGVSKELEVRVAWGPDSALYYDLGGPAVRVAPGEWSVIEKPPVLFRRFAHQLPQVRPQPGGDFGLIQRFLRVREGDRILAEPALIAGLVPGSPRPILCFYGPEGSGKTTTAKVVARLLDPSAALTVRRIPKPDEMAQRLGQWWAVTFDNLGDELPDSIQDALSAAVTGDGDIRRVLYTTADTAVMAFRRQVLLTGLTIPLTRADALDRALLGLERIPDEERREETAFWAEFEEALPSILGGAFDMIAKALSIAPRLTLPRLPRMADFARLGAALAEALGYGADAFLDAYKRNAALRHETAISTSAVGQAVRLLMEKKTMWEGTPAALLDALAPFTSQIGVKLDDRRQWPQGPAQLGSILARLAGTLEALGIEFSVTAHKTGRQYRFQRIGEMPSPPSPLHQGGGHQDGAVKAGEGIPTMASTSGSATARGREGGEGGEGIIPTQTVGASLCKRCSVGVPVPPAVYCPACIAASPWPEREGRSRVPIREEL